MAEPRAPVSEQSPAEQPSTDQWPGLLVRSAPAPSLRIALFGAGLVAALLVGFATGKAIGKDPASGPAPAGTPTAIPAHTHASGVTGAGTDLGGLSISAGGYTLVPESTTFVPGVAQPFLFRVVGPDGKPVTSYVTAREKLLHLIVARHDLSGYQHLHPDLAPDGTWQIPMTLPAPGIWRAYADFVVTGANNQPLAVALAVDLTAAGDFQPTPLPPPAREATAGGFTVRYEGTPRSGSTQPLTFRVFAGGAPAADLQRYLGSYGHLVVLREGDLAYLHAHPEDQLVDGGVKFWLAPPSAGRYRAYLDFQVAGQVHTAEFTFQVS